MEVKGRNLRWRDLGVLQMCRGVNNGWMGYRMKPIGGDYGDV